jgi:hypothetical protein
MSTLTARCRGIDVRAHRNALSPDAEQRRRRRLPTVTGTRAPQEPRRSGLAYAGADVDVDVRDVTGHLAAHIDSLKRLARVAPAKHSVPRNGDRLRVTLDDALGVITGLAASS